MKLVVSLTWLLGEFSFKYFFFSSDGKLKKRYVASLTLSRISEGTPWLITWKNPRLLDAAHMGPSNSDIGLERSMVGILDRLSMMMEPVLSVMGWMYCLGKLGMPISDRPFTPLACLMTNSEICSGSEVSIINVASAMDYSNSPERECSWYSCYMVIITMDDNRLDNSLWLRFNVLLYSGLWLKQEY
ncbi:hypothetical protein V2J09_022730 [Rumex salicifolius]